MNARLDNIGMESLKSICNIQSKWMFWFIAIIATVTASFFIFYLNNVFYKEHSAIMAELSQPLKFGPQSRVYIDFGNGKKRAFEGRVLRGISARIILIAVSEAGEFDLIFTKDKKKLLVADGVRSGTDKKWNVYLNEENKLVEDLSILVHPGGKLTLIYK